MKVTRMKLSALKVPEKNVRIHSEKQTKEFVRSLEAFGQIRPIVIDEDNTILAGNGLYAALMAKGDTEAGVDDMDVFEEFLKELGDDLEIPGYDEDLLKTITADLEDVDEMLSGYGVVSESTKDKIADTAQKYEAQEAENMQAAEEIKPANPAAEQPPDAHGEPLPKRFIQGPKCGNKIWL